MSWILVAVAGAGWILSVALLVILPERYRREAKKSSLRLRAHVAPYLKRRASEVGLQTPPLTAPPSQPPEEMLQAICDLADRLAEHERAQLELGDTMNMAVSDTMPVGISDIKKTDENE